MNDLRINEILNENLINLNLHAQTKKEVIEKLTDQLYQEGNVVDKQAFVEDVFLREKEGMTGIGNHIAIPHGKSDAVRVTSIAIGRVREGIPWESLVHEPVRMIILFAVRNVDKTTIHLKLLSEVAMALADDETLEKLLKTEDKQEVIHLLSQEMGG